MADEAQGVQGVGQALQEAREAQGLSLEDVAKAMKLSNSTIRRLESEDWEGMQAPVYVRGYIRSYAHLVGLDEHSLLSLYNVVDVRTEPRIELTAVEGGYKGFRTFWVFASVALAVVAVVVVGLLLVFPESEEGLVESGVAEAGEDAAAAVEVVPPAVEVAPAAVEVAPASIEVAPAVVEVAPVAVDGAPVAVEDAPVAVQQGDAAPTAPAVLAEPEAEAIQEVPPLVPMQEVSADDGAAAAAEPVAAAADLTEDAEQAAEAAQEDSMPQLGADQSAPSPFNSNRLEDPPVEALGVFRLTPLGDDEIELLFSDRCWVEVKNLDGDFLYAALGEPNDRRLLVGQGPFDIKLGYSPGVELRFNGAPVPLAPHTRDRVATLVLGR